MRELKGICRMKQGENPVKVRFLRESSSCRLRTDRKRLMQVMTNFLTDAGKFRVSAEIVCGYSPCGGKSFFYVKDTGIGISKDHLENVFLRFVRLNESCRGSGVGPALCKALVEQMGGRIGVGFRECEGSPFWSSLSAEPVEAQ